MVNRTPTHEMSAVSNANISGHLFPQLMGTFC
ncbi:hypothetical protein T4C_10188 [Trichinella pseudospiralis]|uniref:Uncharacterized protein n=1 Tax=Trichinella pseudospiralis TaxID=6337 RepID=A0A0V1GK49_TRIPS|nr:hypothetical protein T4C_10188 [Trichinella pseudospiralis]